MWKSILQIIYSCSVQKTARKKTKYSRNETILKIDHQAEAIAMQNLHLGSKIKIPKKHVKIYSTNHLQLFCGKKPLEKKLKWSRNETILKTEHQAKAIAHAKSSLGVKN